MAPATRHELACSEVWGGNGAVDVTLELPGLACSVSSTPYGEHEGGDVYYLSACMSGTIARGCIADVVGHGDEVGQVSRWLHESLREDINDIDPAHILGRLNRRVVNEGLHALTTAACFSFHSSKASLLFCYAGHPPALIRRKGKDAWDTLDVESREASAAPTNTPLGVVSDVQYDVGRVPLDEGDRILLYSDGVTETRNAAGDQYGEERLRVFLEAMEASSLKELSAGIREDLERHAGAAVGVQDDVTLILLEVAPIDPSPLAWKLVKNRLRKLCFLRRRTLPMPGDPSASARRP